MFSTEIELLEFRFMELYDSVDYFILVESDKTHTGKPKPLVYSDNKDRFNDFNDKVIYLQVGDFPKYDTSTHNGMWGAENMQRNAIMFGLESVAEIGDKVLVSDCDEIWNKKVLTKHLNQNKWMVFQQKLYYYYLNCIQNQNWYGTVLADYGSFNNVQDLRNFGRNIDFNIHNRDRVIDNGGWHYSFMGGADKIKEKVDNIAESSLIIDKIGTIDEIKQKMETIQDLWGRTENYAKKSLVDISDGPEKIKEFINKYPTFIK